MATIKTRYYHYFLLVMITFGFLSSSQIGAEMLRLEDIIISEENDYLLISFDIKGFSLEDIEKTMLRGIHAEIEMDIGLYRYREFWFDKKIKSIKVKRLIAYNSVKHEFVVGFPLEEKSKQVFNSINQAASLAGNASKIKICSTNKLVKSEHYKIRAKATIRNKAKYLSFIQSIFILEKQSTDWYSFELLY